MRWRLREAAIMSWLWRRMACERRWSHVYLANVSCQALQIRPRQVTKLDCCSCQSLSSRSHYSRSLHLHTFVSFDSCCWMRANETCPFNCEAVSRHMIGNNCIYDHVLLSYSGDSYIMIGKKCDLICISRSLVIFSYMAI